MFQNLDQVKSWLQNGGTAIAHTPVEGEDVWIHDEVAHLTDLIARDSKKRARLALVDARARTAYEAAMEAYKRKVASRAAGDETSTRLRKQVDELKQQVAEKEDWLAETLELMRLHERGSAERKAVSKGYPQAQQDLPHLKGQLKAAVKELNEYLNVEKPIEPEESDFLPDAPDDAQETVLRYQAFLAAASTTVDITPLVAFADIYDVLEEHIQASNAVKSKLEETAATLGVDASKLHILLEPHLNTEMLESLQSILPQNPGYGPAYA